MADGVSILGTQIQRVAVLWQLSQLTGSPFWLGMLGLVQFVPMLIFGLYGGAFADRVDRRKILIGTHIALMGTSGILAVATATDTINMPLIFGVITISSSLNAFAGPARHALIPTLVPRAEIAGAATVANLVMQSASIAGPAIGGLLIAWHGVTLAYVYDACSFVAVIVAAWKISARPAFVAPKQRGLSAIRDGLVFLWATPILLSVMVLDFIATFFGAFTYQVPLIAERLLGAGAEQMGLLLSAPAAGAVIGSLLLGVLPIPQRAGLGVILTVIAYGGCVLGFALSTNLTIALLFLAGSGGADAVSMALRQAIRNLVTPDHYRGRIAAVHSTFAMGGPQLGELRAGAMASLTSLPFAIASGGIMTILGCLLMVRLVPGLARYRTDTHTVEVIGAPPSSARKTTAPTS